MDQDVSERRLARLERSNRRLRLWLVVVTFCLVVGGCFMPFSVVRNVVGGQSLLVSTFRGHAIMGFRNNRQERRLELGVASKGPPTINLLGSDERPHMALWINEDDTPTLMLMSPGLPGGL